MIRDLKDRNRVIISMRRGTDRSYEFYATENGSPFNFTTHTINVEGKISPEATNVRFTFPFETFVKDGLTWGRIKFPSSLITYNVRESKIYFSVFATENTSLEKKIIQTGEIWLQ